MNHLPIILHLLHIFLLKKERGGGWGGNWSPIRKDITAIFGMKIVKDTSIFFFPSGRKIFNIFMLKSDIKSRNWKHVVNYYCFMTKRHALPKYSIYFLLKFNFVIHLLFSMLCHFSDLFVSAIGLQHLFTYSLCFMSGGGAEIFMLSLPGLYLWPRRSSPRSAALPRLAARTERGPGSV